MIIIPFFGGDVLKWPTSTLGFSKIIKFHIIISFDMMITQKRIVTWMAL